MKDEGVVTVEQSTPGWLGTTEAPGAPGRVWLTKEEAAEHVRVRPRTIDRWANEGRITRYKVDGMQSVRFSRDELDSLIRPDEPDADPAE